MDLLQKATGPVSKSARGAVQTTTLGDKQEKTAALPAKTLTVFSSIYKFYMKWKLGFCNNLSQVSILLSLNHNLTQNSLEQLHSSSGLSMKWEPPGRDKTSLYRTTFWTCELCNMTLNKRKEDSSSLYSYMLSHVHCPEGVNNHFKSNLIAVCHSAMSPTFPFRAACLLAVYWQFHFQEFVTPEHQNVCCAFSSAFNNASHLKAGDTWQRGTSFDLTHESWGHNLLFRKW